MIKAYSVRFYKYLAYATARKMADGQSTPLRKSIIGNYEDKITEGTVRAEGRKWIKSLNLSRQDENEFRIRYSFQISHGLKAYELGDFK